MSGEGVDQEIDPIERDVELAWELYDVRPDHPEIGRLATRVLAEQPGRNGTRILLAMHRKASGAVDEAREILLSVAGQRDRFFVDVARKLRDLEQGECNYAEARRWAEAVLAEDQESGMDLVELGLATAMCGDLEAGWQLIDDGVAQCASTDHDSLPHALIARSIYLLQTWAPPERFVVAAEQAMRADPSSQFIGGPLAWAYVREGRFDDAEQLCQRILRVDPTDEIAPGVLTMITEMRAAVADGDGDITLADVHEAGVVDMVWSRMRDELLGTDLASALAALEPVLPDELRAALRPPLLGVERSSLSGVAEIVAWHDGQEPGTGSLWGVGNDFRLMSNAEIAAMDDEIEARPESYPQWQQQVAADYYEQVMTDDAGGHLIVTFADVVLRRDGVEDVFYTPSLTDWFWDRVAAFGGRDPRPVRVATTDAAG